MGNVLGWVKPGAFNMHPPPPPSGASGAFITSIMPPPPPPSDEFNTSNIHTPPPPPPPAASITSGAFKISDNVNIINSIINNIRNEIINRINQPNYQFTNINIDSFIEIIQNIKFDDDIKNIIKEQLLPFPRSWGNLINKYVIEYNQNNIELTPNSKELIRKILTSYKTETINNTSWLSLPNMEAATDLAMKKYIETANLEPEINEILKEINYETIITTFNDYSTKFNFNNETTKTINSIITGIIDRNFQDEKEQVKQFIFHFKNELTVDNVVGGESKKKKKKTKSKNKNKNNKKKFTRSKKNGK